MRAAAVSVPGKLILMGEHAAVYHRPAVVAAVGLRLRVEASPGATNGVEIHLPQLQYRRHLSWSEIMDYTLSRRERWLAYSSRPGLEAFRRLLAERDEAHLVTLALGEAQGSLGQATAVPLALSVESALPIGAGFGSSAAVAVGVVAAYLQYRGVAKTAEVQRLALEVERRQHGFPSGVDSAAVALGGVVWARKEPSGSLTVEPLVASSSELSRIRIFNTGTPGEPTGAVVAEVRTWAERNSAAFASTLDRMEAATTSFRGQLETSSSDPGKLVSSIREYESCLETLGVVPQPVQEMVRRVEAEGGAAKISGAGSLSGPGAGSLLVYHPEEECRSWPFLAALDAYQVDLGAEGLRREVTA